ncbi:solute carrier family 2, facilitated glucose transporter member 11-like [Elgaria multicarinata webbii]|uniref:solute carrier family 2, facilitated glucose transporter member 11-like n=1 Tax=Elgaria multicarinata webbii TaxID=159646 RepID=UPI002FCD4405
MLHNGESHMLYYERYGSGCGSSFKHKSTPEDVAVYPGPCLAQYRTFFQMILVLGIGGNLPIGYQISVINYPSVYIKRFMNETWFERTGSPLHEKTLLFLWSFIVSIYGVGGLMGCVCSGFLTVKYGKKKSLLGTDLLILATAMFVGFSKRAKSFEMILIGRFLYGVSAGSCMAIHPQYAGEISPKKLRGFANATSGFFWSLGKSLGQILGLREFLGTESSWPLLLGFVGAAALLQLLTLPFFPESPPYLLIQKGDEGGCLKAMHELWGQGSHQEELSDLKKEVVTGKNSNALSAGDLLRDGSLRRQLHVLIAVVLTLQLCGINAVYFYTFEVFRSAGFEEDLIPYISLGVGLCELSSSLLCIFTIERFGRRTLLWKGCGMMAVVLFLLTVTLSLQNKYNWMSHCSVTLVFLFVIFFGIGPNGATMSVMMEIFSQSARPAAFMIGGCLNWAGLFVIGITFPFAVESLGPFCFLIFMVVLVGSGMFFYLFLPETKGKSVVEITEEFNIQPPFGKKLAAVLRKGFHEDHSVYTNF